VEVVGGLIYSTISKFNSRGVLGRVTFLMGSLGEGLAGLRLGGSQVKLLVTGELRWASSIVGGCDKQATVWAFRC